jgi:hypothetical protein
VFQFDSSKIASHRAITAARLGLTFAWRAVRKVDPIRNRALCKRRLDALRTEVAGGNANEGAPDERQ